MLTKKTQDNYKNEYIYKEQNENFKIYKKS